MEDLVIIKQKLSRNWELVESDITSKDAKYYRTIYPEAKIEIRTCLFGNIKNLYQLQVLIMDFFIQMVAIQKLKTYLVDHTHKQLQER